MAKAKEIPENMLIYEGHREPPKEALKTIGAGRLKGFSDINPMWRIKALTEEFGPAGIGWYYTVDKMWLEPCGNETVAFVNIFLYVKVNGEWSQPIFGNGGSKIIQQERNGAYINDECFKMAITDAIGNASKQLGIAADVYWNNDRTKYEAVASDAAPKTEQNTSLARNSKPQKEEAPKEEAPISEPEVDPRLLVTKDNKMTMDQYNYLLSEIKRTDAMKDVVAYTKTEDLSTISSSKCVALLTGLLKRPSKQG